MTTPVRSLAEQQKFRRIVFSSSFSFLFFPNNKNSAEFFGAFGSFIILDTRIHLLMVQPVSSLSSSVSAFVSILANRSSTAQPVLQVSLYSFLRIARPLRLPPIHPSTSFVPSTSFLSTVQVSYGLLFPPVWGFLLRPPLQVRFVALFV